MFLQNMNCLLEKVIQNQNRLLKQWYILYEQEQPMYWESSALKKRAYRIWSHLVQSISCLRQAWVFKCPAVLPVKQTLLAAAKMAAYETQCSLQRSWIDSWARLKALQSRISHLCYWAARWEHAQKQLLVSAHPPSQEQKLLTPQPASSGQLALSTDES